MAVGFAREGCGGRESDKNPDFEPPMGFVISWSASTCVHNRSHRCGLDPEQGPHLLGINRERTVNARTVVN